MVLPKALPRVFYSANLGLLSPLGGDQGERGGVQGIAQQDAWVPGGSQVLGPASQHQGTEKGSTETPERSEGGPQGGPAEPVSSLEVSPLTCTQTDPRMTVMERKLKRHRQTSTRTHRRITLLTMCTRVHVHTHTCRIPYTPCTIAIQAHIHTSRLPGQPTQSSFPRLQSRPPYQSFPLPVPSYFNAASALPSQLTPSLLCSSPPPLLPPAFLKSYLLLLSLPLCSLLLPPKPLLSRLFSLSIHLSLCSRGDIKSKLKPRNLISSPQKAVSTQMCRLSPSLSHAYRPR